MRSTIVAATALAMALLAPAGPGWAAGTEAQLQLKGPCCVGGKIKILTETVKPLKNGCCRLVGSLATPAAPTGKDTLAIDFCLDNRVLVASGKVTSTSGIPPAQRVCEGSFKMSRLP